MDSRHQEIARCLFRESNDALFIFDPADHRVVDVNPAALRLTGFEKDALCALRLPDLFTGAEPGGLVRLVDAYLRTGYFHSREGYFLGRRSGEPIPVNVSVSRIHTAPEPLGLVVARDVTERVRAQQALWESEARFRGLIETAKVVIFAVSGDGRIGSLNPAFEAVTGRTRAGWVGRPFAELVHPEDRSALAASFHQAMGGGSPTPFEMRVFAADGGVRVLEVLSVSRQEEGGREGVSGFARDVTEGKRAEDALRRAEALRRAKEAAEAADRAKSEFLGNVSHEIRTPMTSILGFTELLLEDERVLALPDDAVDDLRTIQRNGNHLLALINDILDLTKIEVGKLRVESTPCSPAAVAEDVAGSMRPRAEAKGLSLVVEAGPGVPEEVRTDPVRLRQILINLVSNAIKFTEAGGVRIRLKGDPEAGPGPAVVFEVADTGVGIAEGDVGQLFELFSTSDARTTSESGAGLGLAISRRLAELLGGGIGVRSRPGDGSVFTLTLPLAAAGPTAPEAPALAGEEPPAPPSREPDPAPAVAAPEPAAAPAETPEPLGGRRVLVAEDNESIRRYVAFRLGRCGAEVALAGNGQEAVDAALAARDEGRPFDWVLMDVQMPVLDGFEATRRLRREGYAWPIIALTAYAVSGHREECLRFGCDDHVSKPVDWPRLLEVLDAHRPGRRGGDTAEPPAADPSGVAGGRP